MAKWFDKKFEFEFEFLSEEIEKKLSIRQIRQWAKQEGFMVRRTKLKPEQFLLLLLSEDSIGNHSLVQLCASLSADFNVVMTTEGLNQRFNSRAVKFLKACFYALFMRQLDIPKPIAIRRLFNRIRILDSTSFDLSSIYEDYKGANGSGVKIQLEYELYHGNFLNLAVQEGIESDAKYPEVIQDIQQGDLCLRDMGYYSIDNLLDIEKQGGYFISRVKQNINLYKKNDNGKWEKIDPLKETEHLKPGEVMELDEVKIGGRIKNPLITRVIFAKLTEEQVSKRQAHLNKKKKKGKSILSAQQNIAVNIYITNIPQTMVKKEDIHAIYSLRWQIEILFKTWKSLFKIHRVKKMKKERFECQLYGTLIRIILCSTLAFHCRRMLYIKDHMETSEFKSISIVIEAMPGLKDVIINKILSFKELL